jgi:hypothetical protein
MPELINKITPLPPAPDWSGETPAIAEEKALAFTAALPSAVEELNEAISEINARESEVIEISQEALDMATEAKAKSEATETLVNEGNVAHTIGDETINGIKTFLQEPVLPAKSGTAGNNPAAPATEAQLLAAVADTVAYIEIITSSKTWTAPKTGVGLAILIGGGGSGGAAPVLTIQAYGGGGAGYTKIAAVNLIKDQNYTCVVGAGGASKAKNGGTGNTGGSTSFDTDIVAGGMGGGAISRFTVSGDSSQTIDIDQNGNNGFTSGKMSSGGIGLFGYGGGGRGSNYNAASGAGSPGAIILIVP